MVKTESKFEVIFLTKLCREMIIRSGVAGPRKSLRRHESFFLSLSRLYKLVPLELFCFWSQTETEKYGSIWGSDRPTYLASVRLIGTKVSA